jgi:hypothetical protein
MMKTAERILSENGQALLDLLVSHMHRPETRPDRPETFISYGEALEALHLPPGCPQGSTSGETLQLNGLNDLARWINLQPKLPRITGLIVSRNPIDDMDGERRPAHVPGKGFFREYRRKPDDWPWWLEEVSKSFDFDWAPYVSKQETFSIDEARAVSLIAEGKESTVAIKVRERSARLRILARAYFRRQAPDGKLHCAACGWTAPDLPLSREIVEVHHAEEVHALPKKGREQLFAEIVKSLVPLCPNCHRMLHSKGGGGSFTLADLRQRLMVPSTGPR